MKTACRFRNRLLPLLALLGVFVPAACAAADANCQMEMAVVAKNVKAFLDGKGETAVAVGQFVGPVDLPCSSGPAIASALANELRKLGVEVKRRGAAFTIQGRYELVEDNDSLEGLHLVAVVSAIVDRKGEEVLGPRGVDSCDRLRDFFRVLGPGQLQPRGIYGAQDAASLLGLTFSLPPAGNAKERDREVAYAYEIPPYAPPGKTRVAPHDAPFAVEILVKEGDKFVPRAVKDVDGLAFVELKKDEVYRVRVYNDAAYEVMASLYIDGLSMFHFSELRDSKNKDKPLYDRLLVASHGSYDIPGWHRNSERNGSDQFLVTKYADSEAAQLYPYSDNTGTITVTFAACWLEDCRPPPDEPPQHAFELFAGSSKNYVMRRYGVLRAAVSVRYQR